MDKIVPDTSIIIEGLLSQQLAEGKIKAEEVIIHEATLAELEHQANLGKSTGLIGLDEITRLKKYNLRFSGKRPGAKDIEYAHQGEIDSLIRQLAYEEDATLLTADKVQAKVAEARGIKVQLIHKAVKLKKLLLENFFDPTTMSVHLRAKNPPMAKRGRPGAWDFVKVREQELDEEEIKTISSEIIESARKLENAFIEIEREGSTIVQLGNFRIVILRPPFSDNWEITAVRPVKKLSFEEYAISEKLKVRILEQADGILIAGKPGEGKSTFAQAVIEAYAKKGKIIKTVEAPRDLVLPESITQLAFSRSSPEEIHDILLLSRPDYSLFDEMRNPKDFELYSDMRLSGVGMLGVIHGTCSLDAIQRFIGRIELGVIPHVVDTLVFISKGEIAQVLSIEMIVKVPSGMTEEDLARPVVVITDFETGRPVAEIYSYGEETVVVPVREGGTKDSGLKSIAADAIKRKLQKYSDDIEVEMIGEHKAAVYVPERNISNMIGREGKTVKALEKELGIGLDIRELTSDKKVANLQGIPYVIGGSTKHIELIINQELQSPNVDIHINGEYLATMAIGKKGIIRINVKNKIGKAIQDAIENGEQVILTES